MLNVDQEEGLQGWKDGRQIHLLSATDLKAVFTHPAQLANTSEVTRLIAELRRCDQPQDYYEFQRELFGAIYSAEQARGQSRRNVKRLKQGKSLSADAPELPTGRDPKIPASWELESYVYERIARQLRVVGDGLAWRAFGYDRTVILALARNESPGMMHGKEGLGYELGRVVDLWKDHGHFALLHDLTNCLRIADLTEFDAEGNKWLREIKARPHVDSKQLARAQTAIDAIMKGGPLARNQPRSGFFQADAQYRTDLKALSGLLDLAKERGFQGIKLKDGRAIIATALLEVAAKWQHDHEEGGRQLQLERARTLKRACIQVDAPHLRTVSADMASRSPVLAPYSIYPFDPHACAALICDLVVVETVVSVAALQRCLSDCGLKSKVLLPSHGGGMAPGEKVLNVYGHGRKLTVHAPSLYGVVYELLEPRVWANGIAEIMTAPTVPGEPHPIYRDEARTWTRL